MPLFSRLGEVRRLRKALEASERKLDALQTKRERERDAQYQLHLNMLDRFFTNQVKTHAVSMDVVESLAPPKKIEPPDLFAGWGDAEREYDIKCFREAGYSQADAEQKAKDAYIQNYVIKEQR